MSRNPVCAILWRDATYSFIDEVPQELPSPQLTCGFIIKATNDYAFIATNVSYDPKTKTIHPIDGMIIPEKAIISFRKIDFYDE